MGICGVDGKNIINRGNNVEVNGLGLVSLIATGVIPSDEMLFAGRFGKACDVKNVLLSSKHLRLRGYATFDKGCITEIGFDEIFWTSKVLPSKNDILRFMSIVKRPDELDVTFRNLRAWWD